jgi:CHAT domain-containing protein/predicted negative regulator of RcsB-dependent stress response
LEKVFTRKEVCFMLSAIRTSFYFLALSLMIPALWQSQILAAPESSPQLTDEETLRRMTEQYVQAIAASNLEAIRRFWNPQSANLNSRMPVYQKFFSTSRLEFVSLKVTRVEIRGEKAIAQMTTDERQLDKVTGAVLTERELFHGAVRAIEWIKTSDGWKIDGESSLQEQLAIRLDEAASENESRELLEKEKSLVTDVLVNTLLDRSTRYRFKNDFQSATRIIGLAQEIAEKLGDQAGLAKAWLYLGMLKEQQSDLKQALPLQQRALAIHEAAGNKLGVAAVLYPLSHTYHELGDYQKAFESAHRALRLAEELKHRAATAHALSEMAHVYIYQNNPQQALASLEKALAIFQELGDKAQVAIKRFTIVTQMQELGEYDNALETYHELLKQVEGYGDKVGGAIIRLAIGRIYFAQGKNAEAMENYSKALQATNDGIYAIVSVVATTRMSEVYLAEKKYKDALPLGERAVKLARQMADKDQLRDALTSLGFAHLGLNQMPEARQAFSEAISTIEKLRAQTSGGVEESQRHFELMLDAYHGMLRISVQENHALEALIFAERAKARGLLDMMAEGRVSVLKAMTAEEQEKEGRLKAALTQTNTQVTNATQANKPDAVSINEFKSQREKARLEYEAFQNSLYAAHPELRIQRGEAPVINAEELKELLPDATNALLEYVVMSERIYLFAITKANGKAEIKVYALPLKRTELAREIEIFRRQLAARDLGFRASALKLYEKLLRPALAQLRGKTNLIIAPDDTLWDLPFQALLSARNRFLIEDAAISYAPSLTVLREMSRRQKNQRFAAASSTLLALGNPLVGKETIGRAELRLRDEKLTPLPEAEEEVKALRQLYGASRSKVYIGAEAREDRVKSEAGQAKILHFAAHGMLNNSSPMYSHLALAEGVANEDGLLEAWELMQLDLKAELAVLSACETARGRIGAGEGMIGLSWAMFVAGVPSLVVSQWKVESAGTRDLMVNFHRAWMSQPEARKKLSKAEALRQAALSVMKNEETRHPFYWAGFVLVGNGN